MIGKLIERMRYVKLHVHVLFRTAMIDPQWVHLNLIKGNLNTESHYRVIKKRNIVSNAGVFYIYCISANVDFKSRHFHKLVLKMSFISRKEDITPYLKTLSP